MTGLAKGSKLKTTLKDTLWHLAMPPGLVLLTAAMTLATENGGTVYPLGVDTVMPGTLPPAGGTVFAEFDMTYQAHQLLGAGGQSMVPGFRLAVYGIAPKVYHNWGVHLLGGTLVSAIAFPILNERVRLPSGFGHKTGFSNAELGVAYVAYNTGAWRGWYGLDVWTPGFSYHKNDLVNVGQHYFSTVPAGAFTYLPNHHRTEISSRFQYLVNLTNPATHYRSGNEFTWEYAAMQNVTKKVALGVNGYYYQQATDDWAEGVRFGNGNHGRDLTLGPQIRCRLGRFNLIAKYQKDTLVQNRARGNAFWFEFGDPLGHVHGRHANVPPAEEASKNPRASL